MGWMHNPLPHSPILPSRTFILMSPTSPSPPPMVWAPVPLHLSSSSLSHPLPSSPTHPHASECADPDAGRERGREGVEALTPRLARVPSLPQSPDYAPRPFYLPISRFFPLPPAPLRVDGHPGGGASTRAVRGRGWVEEGRRVRRDTRVGAEPCHMSPVTGGSAKAWV